MTNSIEKTSVLLLAAGRGQRMLELTENTPKPLLKIGDRSLIEHHLVSLAARGFRDIVINLAYRGEQIEKALGDGSAYGVSIQYSHESGGALETAGGIRHALTLLNSDPFLVVNADIYTDFLSSDQLVQLLRPLDKSARILMIDNPSHNKTGDFTINKQGLAQKKSHETSNNLTFSGIAIYHKSLFLRLKSGKRALAPVFHSMIDAEELEADYYAGSWTDVGTPERLTQLNKTKEQQ